MRSRERGRLQWPAAVGGVIALAPLLGTWVGGAPRASALTDNILVHAPDNYCLDWGQTDVDEALRTDQA